MKRVMHRIYLEDNVNTNDVIKELKNRYNVNPTEVVYINVKLTPDEAKDATNIPGVSYISQAEHEKR